MEKELILTAGEWAVAKEYAKGLQDKEVAENLGKSVWTTKTQKKSIYLVVQVFGDTGDMCRLRNARGRASMRVEKRLKD